MQYGNAAGETIIRYDNFPTTPTQHTTTSIVLMAPSMSSSTDCSPSSSGSNQR
ncbi:hypothetical protein [Haloarcula laminariae]|uniref:hypothetical protein n=1 Tax=Haloarcula laminariae TaxID=2961577 RepID=UPI002404ABA8|nr:hypothetical protein [Halomicroarcula sp. FL173]